MGDDRERKMIARMVSGWSQDSQQTVNLFSLFDKQVAKPRIRLGCQDSAKRSAISDRDVTCP